MHGTNIELSITLDRTKNALKWPFYTQMGVKRTKDEVKRTCRGQSRKLVIMDAN